MYNKLNPHNNINLSGIRYGQDGTGRDTYIYNNMGGFTVDSSPAKRAAPSNMLPQERRRRGNAARPIEGRV